MRIAWIMVGLTSFVSASGSVAANEVPDKGLTRARTDVLYRASDHRSLGSPLAIDGQAGNQRSIPMAFGLSVLVPGMGQVYNGSWWKAGIAIAAEAALITAYVTWRNRGNEGVDEYEAYAHQKWSPVRYAEWLNAFSGYTGPDIEIPALSESELMDPGTWTPEQQAEVRSLINDIRAAERQASYLQTGAGFSHVLPYFGEQQYYELIGKYFQYAPGWVDYTFDPDANPESVMPENAEFYYYADIHADANDYLRKSSWAGAFVIINHFAAGIEAAVSAKLHNMSLRPQTSMRFGPFGEPVATAGVVVDF